MSKCYFCGDQIDFIKTNNRDSEGKKIILTVVAGAKYFLPDADGISFYNKNGILRKGKLTQDGIRGWYPHNCKH